MSYIALYRKFRPSTFEEVRGQEAIVTTLKNQVKTGRTQHAYLFCGTRGTGKTTIAKILARAVNCEHPVDGSPCGECPLCRQIATGNSMNMIEIDAASNNGVDNIRDIIDEVRYRPPSGNYKVYIIDEVHMLSAGAFNALLKTLEEPPSYVIFILATTEPNKIPMTILSRCQRYDFRRIGTDTITARLRELVDKEGASAEEEALHYIARTADGSMRDALSLLDECLSFLFGQTLTYDKVLEVLGAVDTSVFDTLLLALAAGDTPAVLTAFEKMVANGREPGQLMTDFIWYLRNILMIKAVGTADASLVDASAERRRELEGIATQVSDTTLTRYIRSLSDLINRIRFAANRRVLTEIALVSLTRPEMEQSEEALMERIRLLEERVEELSSRPAVYAPAEAAPAEKTPEPEQEEEVSYGPAAPEQLQRIKAEWKEILKDPNLAKRRVDVMQLDGCHLKFDPEAEDPRIFIELKEGYGERTVKDTSFRLLVENAIARRIGGAVSVEMYEAKEKRNGLYRVTVDQQLARIGMPIEEEE